MPIRSWNPYLLGALAGLVLVASVAVAGQYLGASTTFSRSAAVIENAAGVDTSQIEYFTTKDGKYGPGSLPNWQFMFVIGVALGSFAISKMTGSFKHVPVPPMWAEQFGNNPWKRGVAAFVGGAIALFGVRLAGGCPSGHGLSGLSQMAVSGFIALACFFLFGVITAKLVYARR